MRTGAPPILRFRSPGGLARGRDCKDPAPGVSLRTTGVGDAEVSREEGRRLALFRRPQIVLWPKVGSQARVARMESNAIRGTSNLESRSCL